MCIIILKILPNYVCTADEHGTGSEIATCGHDIRRQ